MPRFIFGKRPVAEVLEAGFPKLEALVLAKGLEKKEADRFAEMAGRAGVAVQWQARAWLDRQSRGGNHQGVAAWAPEYRYADLVGLLKGAGPSCLLLVLDQVQDPQNLGAILRSAEGAGCAAVVIPKDHAAAVTPAAERASAGASALLPVCQVGNLSQALDDIKGAGFWCYGLAGGAEESVHAQEFSGKVCLVLGSEGRGLRPLVARHCDKLLKLPMRGRVASLNVSVAAGIALFEAARQLEK